MPRKWKRIREILEEVEQYGKTKVDIVYFSTFMDFIEFHDIWEDYEYYVKGQFLYIKKVDRDDN